MDAEVVQQVLNTAHRVSQVLQQLLRGRLEVCWKAMKCQVCFGEKLCLLQYTCWIDHQRRVCSNCMQTALNRYWYSIRCSVNHIRSRYVRRKITCRGEGFLPLKTISFLHSQSGRNKPDAPTLISIVKLFGIPSSQWPYILATLMRRYKFKAI